MKRPSLAALAALAVFVGGCLAMAIYMWIAFGGAIPLKPESYSMSIEVKDGQGLVSGTDVRIAGVNVGEVKKVRLDEEMEGTVAEIEIEAEFAPRPADTRATVRLRSLLGERYIELSAGSPDGEQLPEGGALDEAQVEKSVSIEDVIATFDERTRALLSSWLTEYGNGLNGNAPSISATLAALDPFAVETGDALEVVRRQQRATAGLIRDGGGALSALSERQGQLRGLVENSSRVFRATAARNEELADTIRIFPTFLEEVRKTSARNAEFSEQTTPLFNQLRPAAEELSPALVDLNAIAPDLRRLLRGLGAMAKASRKSPSAAHRLLNEQSVALLERSTPWLGGVIPVIDYANSYRREVAGTVGNLAAMTQATLPPSGGGTPLHYVRSALPVNVDSLAAFPQRFGTTRTNPYPLPGQSLELAQGLPQFGDYLCVNRALPSLSPAFTADIATATSFYYTDVPANPNPVDPPSPPCRSQSLLGPATGAGSGYFPNVQPLP